MMRRAASAVRRQASTSVGRPSRARKAPSGKMRTRVGAFLSSSRLMAAVAWMIMVPP